MKVSIDITDNKEEILSILCDPEIYQRTSTDECPTSDKLYVPDDHVYVGGYLGDKIISLYTLNKYRDGYLAHFQVLKPYRLNYARKLAKMFVDFSKHYNVYAEVPFRYPDYINFVRKLGFEDVEVIQDAFPKEGINYPVQVLVRKKS